MNPDETKWGIIMEQRKLFSNREIFAIAWPLLIEQLLSVLVGMADVLMVATLGDTAVSGVSLVDSVSNLVNFVFSAMAAGGTVVCAQFIGAKDEASARKTGGQIILITGSAGLALCLGLLFWGNPFLRLLFGQAERDVLENAAIYMRYTCLSYPFMALYYCGFAMFRAIGNSKVSMKVSLVMNVLNVLGNALCIFVLKMGVIGVAIPTAASRGLAAAITLYLLSRGDGRIRISGLSDFRIDKRIITKILDISIPSGLESGMFHFGKLILQSLVSTLGTAAIAGFAVASNLATYLYLPGNAMGNCMMTVVGQCVGAGYLRQGKENAKKLIAAAYAMLFVICTFFLIFNKPLVALYRLEGEAAAEAQALLLSHTLAMILWPPAFVLPHYFRANHLSKSTMVIVLFSMWFFRIGGGYFCVKVLHTGVIGIWYAMYVDWVFRFVVFLWRFSRMGKTDAVPA